MTRKTLTLSAAAATLLLLTALLTAYLTTSTTPTLLDTRETAVVSLGDSAMAGEGAGDHTPDTNGQNGNWCHRSPHALVHHTALATHSFNLACSGADSTNVSSSDTTHNTESSQSRRLTDLARTHRVTTVLVQVGANDDPEFAKTVVSCVLAWLNPFGKGCRDPLRESWPARLRAMSPKVETALNDIRTAMSEAGYTPTDYTLILLSYASPVTEKIDRFRSVAQGCPIKPEDAAYGRLEAVPQLSEALRGAAERTGTRFLDLSRATEGREACSRGDDPTGEWQRRLTVEPEALRELTEGAEDAVLRAAQQSFHPTAEAYTHMAACVAEFAPTTRRTAMCVPDGDGLRLSEG
ncbi:MULTISPECIES: GDSL-type esterase/lipase family protein [Actinosynnema]|uniref:GDSL-type esterase/lipase family protein n=1 Tax=Actinosynnema TaxID=40566 RepID=UPI0020A6059F|nr:GDSL-type esterase/lipase family protein [Actinosynnema pretiosum]MCP2092264.1 GDSL-like Lipase/Acylhydrolase family protein [Actinosynnema pretiosum]